MKKGNALILCLLLVAGYWAMSPTQNVYLFTWLGFSTGTGVDVNGYRCELGSVDNRSDFEDHHAGEFYFIDPQFGSSCQEADLNMITIVPPMYIQRGSTNACYGICLFEGGAVEWGKAAVLLLYIWWRVGSKRKMIRLKRKGVVA